MEMLHLNLAKVLLFTFLQVITSNIYAQCPGGATCQTAFAFCSVEEMNGLVCNNVGAAQVKCMCSTLQNSPSLWYSFVSSGGTASITLTYSTCTDSDKDGDLDGLNWGIIGDCSCTEQVYCSPGGHPTGNSATFTGTLKPCKVYYLFISSIESDFCQFTINTSLSGGGSNNLDPLGFINNIASGIIEPVCVGACDFKLFVTKMTCEPNYEWTIDGVPVSGNKHEVFVDFPTEGDFEICVTAYLGNPNNGAICAQEGPVCATVRVRPSPDRIGVPRTLCYETVNLIGYAWHSNPIFNSGIYRQSLTENCCIFDSIVEFIVLPKPEEPEVFYITCDNKPYVDMLGRSHAPCKNQLSISLPKVINPYRCDSSIRLTAVNVDFAHVMNVRCADGFVEISPNVTMTNPCDVGESYEFAYKWYKKNDPAKLTLSTDEFFQVKPVDEDYCVDVSVTTTIGTATAICTRTFCEFFREADLGPKCIPLAGDQIICNGKTGFYWMSKFVTETVTSYNWTVTGGTIISSTDTAGVHIKWDPTGTSGKICLIYTTDCGTSCEQCLKITLGSTPAPDAGPNDSICDLVNQFHGKKDIGGYWTQISGPGNSVIADSTDPGSHVQVDKHGMYRYVYSESKSGCSNSDTVDLFFNSSPDSSILSYLCNPKQTQYKLRFQINGGTPPYSIIQGTGSIDVNNFYVSDYHDNLTNYTILIMDAMGCILSFDFNHNCDCTNAVSSFDKTPEYKCNDESFTFLPPQFIPDPNDTLIYVLTADPDPQIAASGTFIKILSSNTIVFDASYMSYNTTYYIIVLLGKKNGQGGINFLTDCIQADGPKSFVFYQNPSPIAGVDDAICGTIYDLDGIQSLTGSNLKWKLISGSGVSITDDAAASTLVNTNGQYGTFVFELSEANQKCISADRVSITFNPVPFISVVEKICLEYFPPFRYQANIKITSGQAPFTIVQGGGNINGNIYSTDTLASLSQFTVEIKDANGCISNLIIDDYNCDCGKIDAGQLDTQLVEVCVDKCVSIKNLLGETTDPEDAVIYVLHQSSYNETNPAFPKLDTFYSINDQVCFNSSLMVAGHTYYITRVVGDSTVSNGNKIVKDSDPCKRVTANQPIVWYAYPTPDPGPADSICFYSYQLNGITNTGTSSWKFLSGPGNSTIANPNSDATNVTVTRKGTYRYELTEDFKGCISRATVDITHWDAPDFINQTAPECDNTAERYRITVDGQNGDRSSWLIDGFSFPGGALSGNFIGQNTWQTDWINNNDVYQLIINDRHNCLPDTISNTYECACISQLGILNKTLITLCKDKTAQAVYDNNTGAPDGNDVIRFLLFDGNPADPKSATHLTFNSNGSFVFDPTKMQTGKTYYIAVFIGNADPNDPDKELFNDRCLKFDVVPVIWYDYPLAHIQGDQLLTCLITTITLDGSGSTISSGGALTYYWNTSNGNITGATTNNTATINAPGTYKLIVTDPISNCSDEITFIVGSEIVKPKVSVVAPELLTCDRTSVVLDGSASSQGTEYSIQWAGPGNITNANSYKPSVDAAGRYYLIVTNNANGCIDSLQIDVPADVLRPIPVIKPLGALVCDVKQIQLDGSNSRAQSGLLQNFNWSTSNGNILAGQGTPIITIDKGGAYQLSVRDQNNGCDSVITLDVVEIPNSLVGFDVDVQDPKCFDQKNGSIDIEGIITTVPPNGLQYSFDNKPFSTTTSFSDLKPGSYRLKVRDANGCEHDTILVLTEPGKLGIQVIKTTVVNQDSLVDLRNMLINISGGTKNYQDTAWLNLDPDINWKSESQYHADTTRDFLITVTDASGCEIEDRVRIIVRLIKDVWWPSAFSPNNDGANDVWNIKGKRIQNIRTLNIYDRWGEMVYSAQNIKDANTEPNSGWNGEFNGQKLLPGVYVFYAEIEYAGTIGVDKYKGELTLIR